ncbi:MAG: helix-turn-helix domain-containing protein [Acidiferrobacterales bacterium]
MIDDTTFDLHEAGAFLKMSAEALRRKAKGGEVPGVKVGKRWCFLKADLVALLRSRYAFPRQASLGDSKEVFLCHYTDVKLSGGSDSPPPPDSEYAALLGLPIKSRPRNSTTASKPNSGKSRS